MAMRFRDFVYSFQRHSKTRVGSDDELRTWLSQAYNAVLGKPNNIQEDYARTCAEIFTLGQRDGARKLELKLIDQVSNSVIFKGSVAVEY